jgi:SpoIID/LytB domain protein
MPEIDQNDIKPYPKLPDSEPYVKVGVVLENDDKKEIAFVLPQKKYFCRNQAGTESFKLTGDDKSVMKVENTGEVLRLTDENGNELYSNTESIVIGPETDYKEIKIGTGITIKDMVAGREFHWRKLVDMNFPGKLEFHKRGEKIILVNDVSVEFYIMGVITSEMSGACPIDLLKSQGIAARSWMLANTADKYEDEPAFQICNDDASQRYQGSDALTEAAIQSVNETRGEILVTSEGDPCDARYSKSCGGILEDADHVWFQKIDGLVAGMDAPEDSGVRKFYPVTEENIREYITGDWTKDTDIFCSDNVVPEDNLIKYIGRVDEAGKYFRWTITYTQDEITGILRDAKGYKYVKKVKAIKTGNIGKSGRAGLVNVIYLDAEGQEKKLEFKGEYGIRQNLHQSFLYSSAFVVDPEPADSDVPEKFVLRGAGWGHGAGLCQIGALGMAFKDYDYKQILRHYFQGIKLVKAYE